MEIVMEDKDSQLKRKFFKLLAGSLFLHLCILFTVTPSFNLSNFDKSDEEQKLIIKLVNNSKSKQIVQTEQSNKVAPVDAKFLSNKNNTFDRETRSNGVKSFKAPALGQRNALQKKSQDTASREQKFKDLKLTDFGLKKSPTLIKKVTKRKVAQTSMLRKGIKSGRKDGLDMGSTSDYLEDIPLGDFTKLNTQEYEFYGFYHRIRQKLEQFWGLNIQEQAEKIMKSGRSIASDTNLVTGLTIKLNSKGEIVDIYLKSTSGVRELDQAAIESFNQAGPFPNPPKGMLKKDGKAIIEWGFVVNT